MSRIGLIQVDNMVSRSVTEAQDHMLGLMSRCLEAGSDITFTPECYQYLREPVNSMSKEQLESYNRRWIDKCSELASKYKAYIGAWDYERTDDGKIYNLVHMIDRNGNNIGSQRKIHIPYMEMDDGVSAGTESRVFDLDIGKVGVMICFDNYFPETARLLQLLGAQLIIYPLYGDNIWGGWELKMRARAVDYSLYVASCQLADPLGAAYTGLVDPHGDIICRLKERDSWQTIEIDPSNRVRTYTSGGTQTYEYIREYLLKARNPEAYSKILEYVETPEWNQLVKIPNR